MRCRLSAPVHRGFVVSEGTPSGTTTDTFPARTMMSTLPIKSDEILSALPPQKLFIDGKWVDSDSSDRLEVHSPSSGTLLATVPHASAKDVSCAVESARRAGDSWRLTPPFERAAACHRIA